MSEPDSNAEERLEAYFDGSMTVEEREAFEHELQADADAASQVWLQQEIDASLRRSFPLQSSPERISAEALVGKIASPTSLVDSASEQKLRRVAQVALLALAACLAWIVVGWQLDRDPSFAPYFQPKPLVQVYGEVLSSGFEPYYECREPDRFANTFLRRQGQALQLATLPTGSRMLGLSYPGGLSRETTAMLCEVDQKPVIVFVDRLENDRPSENSSGSNGLHIHRVSRDGLVLYEVSPLSRPRMIEYLSSAKR